MPEFSTVESNILEHPAVQAWHKILSRKTSPKSIEILKEHKKSSVYRLGGVGRRNTSVIAKRCIQGTASVERLIYEEVLPYIPVPALRYYGFLNSDDGFSWLFFEDAGENEYTRDVEANRILAARWLGFIHGYGASVSAATRLPERTPSYYREQLRDSCNIIQRNLNNPLLSSDNRVVFESLLSQRDFLEERWKQIDGFCEEMPQTVVHGDFVAKNIRVRNSQAGDILLPFDWESAGWGVPASDLNQFSGRSASPDINTYWSIARQFFPQISLKEIETLAKFGMIFRLINAIGWACEVLAEEIWSDEMVIKPLRQILSYQKRMDSAIESVKWGTKHVKTYYSLFPNLDELTRGLQSVFNCNGSTDKNVTIVSRKPNTHMSSFPSEVVKCRFLEGNELRLFCKYVGGIGHNGYGHRGGVEREAMIYQNLLLPLQVTAPEFYGTYVDKKNGEQWLVLKHLDNCRHIGNSKIGLAARWIGEFQAKAEAYITSKQFPFLNFYDAEYYAGWAHRTSLFAGQLHQCFPWLARLCERFEEYAVSLPAIPQTVIHGEYYYKNILVRQGVIYPVDWESAAVSFGEIDLAALTEGEWSAKTVERCKFEYKNARWGEKVPADFEQRLDAARLYLHFRWLGNRPEQTVGDKQRWRFENMRLVGERLGLI